MDLGSIVDVCSQKATFSSKFQVLQEIHKETQMLKKSKYTNRMKASDFYREIVFDWAVSSLLKPCNDSVTEMTSVLLLAPPLEMSVLDINFIFIFHSLINEGSIKMSFAV